MRSPAIDFDPDLRSASCSWGEPPVSIVHEKTHGVPNTVQAEGNPHGFTNYTRFLPEHRFVDATIPPALAIYRERFGAAIAPRLLGSGKADQPQDWQNRQITNHTEAAILAKIGERLA